MQPPSPADSATAPATETPRAKHGARDGRGRRPTVKPGSVRPGSRPGGLTGAPSHLPKLPRRRRLSAQLSPARQEVRPGFRVVFPTPSGGRWGRNPNAVPEPLELWVGAEVREAAAANASRAKLAESPSSARAVVLDRAAAALLPGSDPGPTSAGWPRTPRFGPPAHRPRQVPLPRFFRFAENRH